ncbi:MAG: amidohydrolase family protein, partial [Terriglobia bacterium]
MPRSITRRRFLADSSTVALGAAAFGSFGVEAAPSFDLVLKGGTILDGTGAPAWRVDVGLRGDTIAALGSIAPEQARRVVDVAGLHVCPGFIDIHSHSDRSILFYPTADSRVRQGITTEVTGNCGSSAAPLPRAGAPERRRRWHEGGIEAEWGDVASFFAQLERTGMGVNHALLLGHGTLRTNAIGIVDRPLTAEELWAVERVVEEGMDQGAI